MGTGALNLTIVYDVNVDVTSSINGAGRGSTGGNGGLSNKDGGYRGLGVGMGVNGSSHVSGAGGGAGGSSYGTSGAAGGSGNSGGAGGAAGSTFGTSSGWDLDMGSGAGGGGSASDNAKYGVAGSAGGAMLRINAGRTINIYGTLTFTGGNGGAGGGDGSCCYGGGGGGGGSGGGILLNATRDINLNGATITTAGGNGGAAGQGTTPPYNGAAGGAGGQGRFKAFYKGSFSNTSTAVTSGSSYYEDSNTVPTTPIISNPTNNSVSYETTSINVTWSASTDTDSIGYTYQISNNSAFTDLVASGYTTNLYSGTKTIHATIQQFFRVGANDSYHTAWSPTVSIRDLSLSSPANGSTSYFNYPPMITEFNFLWSATESSVVHYNLLIASDSSFNLIKSDTTFSGTTNIISLDEGTYWYKIRPYYTTTGTYGAYTNAWTFTLVGNVSVPSGTGIHGVVYEIVNGVITPVSGARVIIRNDVLNWTSEHITGSNGYYQVMGLSNTTSYSIYATKTETFKDSVYYYVNPVNGSVSTRNILLERCVSSYDCFYNQQYVKFIVQNFFGTQYSNVAVSVYKGDDVVAEKTGTTGTDGAVSFLLVKDQEYRLTFIKASNDINKEITVVPGESKEFTVMIWSFAENRDDSVAWNLSSSVATASLTNLNLTYSDSSGLTTLINFWVLNGSNISQTIYSTSTATSSLNAGYAVNSTVAGTYVYGFNATRNGVIITGNTVITFAGSSTLIDLKIDSKYYNWISIILLVSVSLLFSYKTNRNGYILVPLLAFLLSIVGWFSISYLITSSVLLIGVIAYLRSAEKQSDVGF